jgi:hypothetical protein
MDTFLLVATVRALLDAPVAREVTREAIDILNKDSPTPRAAGPQMAARAAAR